jgi:hypothetical protein
MVDAMKIKPDVNVLTDSLDYTAQVSFILFTQMNEKLLFSVSIDTTQIIRSNVTVSSEVGIGPSNAGFIATGVLGGILFVFVTGLIVFILWKRRRNKKKRSFTLSWSTTSIKPVVTPPLYNVSISPQNSLPLADPTITSHSHIYEELS